MGRREVPQEHRKIETDGDPKRDRRPRQQRRRKFLPRPLPCSALPGPGPIPRAPRPSAPRGRSAGALPNGLRRALPLAC